MPSPPIVCYAVIQANIWANEKPSAPNLTYRTIDIHPESPPIYVSDPPNCVVIQVTIDEHLDEQETIDSLSNPQDYPSEISPDLCQ